MSTPWLGHLVSSRTLVPASLGPHLSPALLPAERGLVSHLIAAQVPPARGTETMSRSRPRLGT